MMTTVKLKTEPRRSPELLIGETAVIDISSSGSDTEIETEKKSRDSDNDSGAFKKRRLDGKMAGSLPPGFLDPLPALMESSMRIPSFPPSQPASEKLPPFKQSSRQFWKAGDYDGIIAVEDSGQFTSGIDHVRVHPKFLHSNATSHKWALGAFAELLDNSLDEVCNGATYVNIDMLVNKKDGCKMLLIEDDGGGMNPEKMRKCMSLGYSQKSKIANCIGQYGNGFKTSTMRLGADVIVFSCSSDEGKSPTRSIGMLSYTFLRDTGREDIVVPMLDYEKNGPSWEKMMPISSIDWNKNADIIVRWSPFSSESEFLQQFDLMPDHGTRIVIYNLWENDIGKLELNFHTDKHDIQISGVNRDEKNIQMAAKFPNSKHFLTYRHSLRSYASIIYLRLPDAFRMILRGKEIEHHNIVNDMMLKQEVTYRPTSGPDRIPKDPNLVAVVTIGFVKDAKHHIDVQGFNVYHKNRLIKPFWRVWNAAGSDGRGVIGVLEANFVEPAHDKQGFERTTVLSRLEMRLVQMQKTYWSTNCHKVGYAPRCNKKYIESEDNESSPEPPHYPKKRIFSNKSSKENKFPHSASKNEKGISSGEENGDKSSGKRWKNRVFSRPQKPPIECVESPSASENACNMGDSLISSTPKGSPARKTYYKENGCSELLTASLSSSLKHSGGGIDEISTRSQAKAAPLTINECTAAPEAFQPKMKQLEEENDALKLSLKTIQESLMLELQDERNRNKTLTNQLEEANKEQEALIDIFSEERSRRDGEEAALRKRLKDALDEVHDLLDKLAATKNSI